MIFQRMSSIRMADDGRTIEGIIAPYDDPATVIDTHPETGERVQFVEQFDAHSFSRMADFVKRRGNAGWIALNLDHEEHDFDKSSIGYATTIEDREEGAFAQFRLYAGRNLEKYQSMLRESHTGLSVKFADIKPPKITDGIVRHVQVMVEHVAATPLPAYANAGITSMRSDVEPITIDGTPKLDDVRAWLASMRNA